MLSDGRKKFFKGIDYISLAEAATSTPYSQEYLSLLARRKKFKARKLGRNWYVTRDVIPTYLATQAKRNIASASGLSGSFQVQKKMFKGVEHIPLAEAATSTPYSQEYLSLLARRKKFKARKLGRNWYVTRDAIAAYLATRMDERVADAASLSPMLAAAPAPQLFETLSVPVPVSIPTPIPRNNLAWFSTASSVFALLAVALVGIRMLRAPDPVVVMQQVPSFSPIIMPASGSYSSPYVIVERILQGPKGEKGDTGAAGAQGVPGAQGLGGIQAPPGFQIGSVNPTPSNPNSGGTIGGITYFGAKELSAQTLTVTGNTTLASLTATGASITGSLAAGSFSAGATTLGSTILSSASISANFEVSGTASISQLYVNGVAITGGSTFSGLDFNVAGGTEVKITSLSFDANMFDLSSTASSGLVRLDWTNGPVSKSTANTWTALNVFSVGASISTNLEVSGIASISQLYVNGSPFEPFTGKSVTSDSLDFDELANTMTLDGGGLTVSSATYGINWTHTNFTNASGNISMWTNDSSYLTTISSESFWDQAYAYKLIGHLPLAGGTLTGDLFGTNASLSGNFETLGYASASLGFYGNLTGTVTGHSSLDLALTGGTLTGNLVGAYASLSNNLEVSGTASISQLYVNGVAVTGGSGSGRPASDSLDFDEFANSMTLDANTSVASAGYSTTWNGNFYHMDGNVGIGTTDPDYMLAVDARVPTSSVSSTALGAGCSAGSAGRRGCYLVVRGDVAYMVTGDDGLMRIYDISDKSSPVLLGSVDVGSGLGELKVYGDYAYVTNYYASNLYIVNISDPSSPVVVTIIHSGSGARGVFVQGRYLYIADADGNAIKIYDISNIKVPALVSTLSLGAGSFPVMIQVEGRYAYVVNYGYPTYTTQTMMIIDVFDPANPQLKGTIATGTQSTGIYIQNEMAYVVNAGANDLQIIDISSKSNPILQSTLAVGSAPTYVVVQGQNAYVANSSSSNIQVINIASSSSPFLVGTISTLNNPVALEIQGNYLYTIAGDASAVNLQIFDINGAFIQELTTIGLISSHLFVKDNAMLGNDLTVEGAIYSNKGLFAYDTFAVRSSSSATSFMVNTDGNVGVGTTTPTSLLHIVGDSNILLNVASSSNSRFSVLESGNVGIGTTTPVSLLDISNASESVLTLSRNDSGATTDELIGRMDFWNNDTQLTTQNIFARIEARAAQSISTDAAAGYLTFFTTGTTIAAGPQERMRITAAGNVGIGLAAPTSLLHVSGTQPTDATGATGTAGTSVLNVAGAIGGTTTIATTGTGGAGSALTLTTGTGGVANAALTTSAGGNGGTFTITGGAGGTGGVTGGITGTGGTGGVFTWTAGTGGATTNAVSGTNTAGNGGAVTFSAGTGGASSAGTTNAGGAGGAFTLRAGAGGIGTTTGGSGGLLTLSGGTSAAASASAGGGVTITGAAGSSTGSGGAGGALTLTAGAAGGDQLTNRQGGAIALTTGVSVGDLAGGAFTVTGGNAGQDAADIDGTTTGPAGGVFTLAMGNGGNAPNATIAATGGNGGAFTITGGVGGAPAVAGTGNNTGGIGSAFTWTAGTGGAASAVTTGTNIGGAGGAVTISGGTGGIATLGTINTGGNGGLLTLQGGSAAAGAGAAGGGVTITGRVGSTTGNGGIGGTLTLTAGAGGANVNASRVGGSMLLTSGAGGALASTSAAAILGPNGGPFTFTLGAGGAVSAGTGAETGGNGGAFTITPGAGGAATSANATSNTGGVGSAFSWTSGTGGAASGVSAGANLGGNGGNYTLTSGAGGASSNSTLTNTGGTAGTFNLTGGNGGAATTAGVTNTGGGGATINITAGNGGTATAATTNVGGNGGALIIAAGTGGAGTGAAGGTGGSLTLRGGLGGDTADDGGGGHIIFETASTTTRTEAMRITSGSFVGIGTATPQSLLDISNASESVLTLSRNDVTAAADELIGRIDFWNNDTQLTTQKIFARIEARAAQAIGTDAAAGYLSFFTTGTDVAGAPQERMRITTAGRVGVGEITPETMFEVAGTASASSILTTGWLQVAGGASASYSRIGVGITGHGLSATNDLLISGKLEVDGSAYYDGTVNFGSIASSSLFYAGNGTAASPSFAFRADQDTGMFRSVVNQLGFSTLGVERIRVDANGNVGIGATTPEQKLEVNGNILASASGNVSLALRSLSATANDGQFTILTASTSDRLDIRGGAGALGNTLMTIASTGYVGIGTTGPVSTLDVAGTTGLNWNNIAHGLVTLGTVGTGGSLWVNTPSLNASFGSGLGVSGTYGTPSQRSVVNINAYGVNSEGGYGSDLAFSTTKNDVLYERMRIDTNGYVTIGNSGVVDGAVLTLTDANGSCAHNPGASSEAVTCSSDIRLKTDIRSYNGALDYLNGYIVKDFLVKASNTRTIGVIAQELQQVHPELVSVGEDGFLRVEQPNPWVLVKGIQELEEAMSDLRGTQYPIGDGVQEGNIVAPSSTSFVLDEQNKMVPKMVQSVEPYQGNIMGIMASVSPSSSLDPIIMSGKANMTVSLENGSIKVGDRITSSNIPGVGMKATKAGMTVATALENLDSTASGSYQKIMVFVQPQYWAPSFAEAMEGTASSSLPGILGAHDWDPTNLVALIVEAFKSVFGIVFGDGSIQTKQITADEKLCVGDTCITGDQLKELLNAMPSPTSSPSPSASPLPLAPVASASPDIQPTTSPTIEPSATAEPSLPTPEVGTPTPTPSPEDVGAGIAPELTPETTPELPTL